MTLIFIISIKIKVGKKTTKYSPVNYNTTPEW